PYCARAWTPKAIDAHPARQVRGPGSQQPGSLPAAPGCAPGQTGCPRRIRGSCHAPGSLLILDAVEHRSVGRAVVVHVVAQPDEIDLARLKLQLDPVRI